MVVSTVHILQFAYVTIMKERHQLNLHKLLTHLPMLPENLNEVELRDPEQHDEAILGLTVIARSLKGKEQLK